MTIAEKVRSAALTADPDKLYAAVNGVIALAEKMRGESLAGVFIANTILLTLAKPLGLRIVLDQYAQLVDLDEEES